jgi:endoglucanase
MCGPSNGVDHAAAFMRVSFFVSEGEYVMAFTIKRGTNISHWLSQSTRRGEARKTWFTRQDVQRLAAMGFDHLRIPVDEEQMWDEEGNPDREAFGLLDAALDCCKEAGLRAIVDLHILRTHHFLDPNPRLYRDPAEAGRFVGLWLLLSEHLWEHSTDWVAYELLNEAVAPDPEDWNRVARLAFNAVRKREPERPIILGSNRFCTPGTFDRLAVPKDDHCILTFHFYDPMLITHYTARWTETGAYTGPVSYPGTPIAPADLAAVTDAALAQKLISENRPYDRAAMIAELAKPLAVRAQTGYTLYCGEFGCYRRTPQPLRAAWYRDFVGVLNEHQIAWANWDYKGDFGLITPDGPDQAIIDILLA